MFLPQLYFRAEPPLCDLLTRPLSGADSWSLQVRRLNEDCGSVQGIRRKSVKAVLRQPGGNGDLMLSFTGG